MFGAIVAWLYLGDKISKAGVFGLSIGFAGVLVISEQTLGNTQLSILPILGALAATLCYGIAACFLKKHLSHAKPFAVAAGSQLFAAILIMPLAIMYWPQQAISEEAWRDAIILAVMCTGLAYVMYFRLIANVGASHALTVAYLVPLFGITWGFILLDEIISLQSIAGGCLIIFGVMLTTGVLNKVFKRRLAI
jgi:drug/metabolite transporter (DMT)-like permease